MIESGNSGQSLAERTRRQIEELDALLQQLLAVPVVNESAGSEEAAPPAMRTMTDNSQTAQDAGTAAAPEPINDPLVLALDEARSRGDKHAATHRASPGGRPGPDSVPTEELDQSAAKLSAGKIAQPTIDPPSESAARPATPATIFHDASDSQEAEQTTSPTNAISAAAAVLRFPESSDQTASESPPIHRIDPPHEQRVESEADWPSAENLFSADSPQDSAEQETLFGPMIGRLDRTSDEGPASPEPASRNAGASLRNILGWTGVIFLLAAAALGIGALLGWTR